MQFLSVGPSVGRSDCRSVRLSYRVRRSVAPRMIDDLLMNLGTWELGNLGTWELGNFGTWELGNLGTWELGNLNAAGEVSTRDLCRIPLSLIGRRTSHSW